MSTLTLPESLAWDIKLPKLTTQYKSVYFTLDDGSSGFAQLAWGNLGLGIKVAPMAYTFYKKGIEPVVESVTSLAGGFSLSADCQSCTLKHGTGMHALSLLRPESEGGAWAYRLVIEGVVKYDLVFTFRSKGYKVTDFNHTLPAGTSQDVISHTVIPLCDVKGTYQVRGEQPVECTGQGSFVEAILSKTKFTDMGDRWNAFFLRDRDTSSVLHMLQFIPRGSAKSGDERRFVHGSITLDGVTCAITSGSNNSVLHGDASLHPAVTEGIFPIPRSITYTWSGANVKAIITTALSEIPTSQTDVLDFFPEWAKRILQRWAGRPYVCVWAGEGKAKLEIDGTERMVKGRTHNEVTFVHP
ncbi:Putative cell survival pathways protein [Saitoella coloradoensis]